MAKPFVVAIADMSLPGDIAQATPIVTLMVDNMEEAEYFTHMAFENAGLIQCTHPPVPMPDSLKARMEEKIKNLPFQVVDLNDEVKH